MIHITILNRFQHHRHQRGRFGGNEQERRLGPGPDETGKVRQADIRGPARHQGSRLHLQDPPEEPQDGPGQGGAGQEDGGQNPRVLRLVVVGAVLGKYFVVLIA